MKWARDRSPPSKTTPVNVYLRANFRATKDEDVKLDVAFAQGNNWFINWHGIQQF